MNPMSMYTDEEKTAILAAGRQALADAEAVLAKPRPEAADWPPVEDRLSRWRRLAAEKDRRFAEERTAPRPLTDWEAARLQHDELTRMVDEQKGMMLQILAHSLAAVRDEVVEHLEAKLAELSAELGQLRADRTLERAHKIEVVSAGFFQEARRMTTREQIKTEIQIAARVAELRRLAATTTAICQRVTAEQRPGASGDPKRVARPC